MEQVMKHFGNAVLAVVVLLALGAILTALLAPTGTVATQFNTMLSNFFSNMTGFTP